MHVDHYIEDTPDVHWPEILQPLNLYTYKNVYDDHIYKKKGATTSEGFKSQPRTGHTREPDPTHLKLKHTTTR